MIDAVSETSRLSWDAVYAMGIYEFFAIYNYTIDKWRKKEKTMQDIANKYR